MTGLFSSERIREALLELGSRLDAQGHRADLYIVGGAAMALAFDRTRVTRDIDAVFAPKTVVYDVARTMAEESEDLDENWLNDAVKGFLAKTEDDDARVFLEEKGIRVLVASPRRLLAARADRDRDDILSLCSHIGITAIQEVLDLTAGLYGDLLTPKSKFIVIELLQDVLPMEMPTAGDTAG
jgi:Nucleotidyltransferase of unknown function (DUF6036)